MPRGEDHPVGLGGGEQAGPCAVADIVARGDGGDIGDPPGRPELPDADVGQSDVADDALLAQLGERTDLILERDVGCIMAVQTVQVEVVQAEPPGDVPVRNLSPGPSEHDRAGQTGKSPMTSP